MSSKVLSPEAVAAADKVLPLAWPSLEPQPSAAEAPPPEADPAEPATVQIARDELERLVAAASSLDARLEAAARQAEQMSRQAAERGREEGFREGQQEGARASAEKAAAELASFRQGAARQTAESAARLADMRHRMRRQMEEDLVRLAVAIARRILRRELTVDPEALAGIVRVAVDRVAQRELLRIVVCPADVPTVRGQLDALRLPDRVEVAGDASLSPGAVVVETTRGQLDASVETQLAEIDRGLADLFRKQS